MLSRGKLVQDWRRRLAAAEADGAEGERRTWLAQMRLRLYRFLLSCYGDTAWRADEPSEFGDETLADVHRGDTTTLLDCPLQGKPAKTSGKMLAVLKSVSAAQDHPAEAGPLLDGKAAEEWVVAVSMREKKLDRANCQELLRQHGIASTWTLQGELKVRKFDLHRTEQLIRSYWDDLLVKPLPPIVRPRGRGESVPPWPVYFAAIVIAPIGAIVCVLMTQGALAVANMSLLTGSEVGSLLAISYFVSLDVSIVWIFFREARKRIKDGRARNLVEKKALENPSHPDNTTND